LGAGSPTVVIKNAFDETSFDWIAIQAELAKTHGVCAYDRAGYAWSNPCPKPGTFAQINLEMHDVLRQLNERPPYILVGDAFGAATVRNCASPIRLRWQESFLSPASRRTNVSRCGTGQFSCAMGKQTQQPLANLSSRAQQKGIRAGESTEIDNSKAIVDAVLEVSQWTLTSAAQKEMHIIHAKGSFEIKMTPAESTDFEKANDITRVTSDKTWHGDFEGVSHGEMITGSTASTGSLVYVAIERMAGKLNGRQGTFTFSHRATMMKGDSPSAGDLSVLVVPDSGTGELTGLTGSLIIHIDANGKHSWTFDYYLP
jgi:Protein of unknown function (DUF3224)